MSQESFRKFMRELLDQSGLDQTGFDENPQYGAFLAGQRALGAWVRDELVSASPDKYLKLLEEKLNG